MKSRALLAILLVTSVTLTGCLGLFGGKSEEDDGINAEDEFRERVGQNTADRIAARAAEVPRTYLFPNQQDSAWKSVYYNGTVDPVSAWLAYEDRNDYGGNNYNTPYVTFDVSEHVPAGQPTEMFVTLVYFGQPGSSASLDVFVDMPGTKTDIDTTNNDEFSWKVTVKRTVVNTIGIPGENHLVGVQISNGRALPTEPMGFTIKIDFSYARNVLTPAMAWAFDVPANATGVFLSSAKAGGSEHVKAVFAILDPSDNLVHFQEYDDISIPTERVFIPLPGPGEYVFYAFEMRGGFLALEADAGVAQRNVRALPLIHEDVAVASSPSPGIVARDWGRDVADGVARTERVGGDEASFNVDGAFPVAIIPWVKDATGTVMAQIRISSTKGPVAEYQRVLRYDDERGSLGYTSEVHNTYLFPENLAKGAYSVDVVNNSNGSVGYTLVTYKR